MLRSVLRGDAKCPMGIGHSCVTGATGLEPATSGVTGPSGRPYLAPVSQSW